MIDMAELSARSGVPVRKLRYVFDHGVLPGVVGVAPGQGIPRTLTKFEGFAIALGARLLDTGLTRQLIADCLTVACRCPRESPSHAPLYHAYLGSHGRLEIGDGRFVRLFAARIPRVVAALDTRWLPLKGGVLPAGYTPAVLVTVELGTLAETINRK